MEPSNIKKEPTPKVSNDEREESRRATWNLTRSQFAIDWKRALGIHTATHFIKHGDVVQGGPGTTNVALMDAIVERQVTMKRGLDLIFMTTSLPVMAKGRDAKEKHVEILQGMQLILTGGAFQGPIDSLVGPYAVQGIRSEMLRPNWVFFGAAGLSFVPSVSIRYQFDDELATQEAYATRPTDHRVLLCDHTKLGRDVGWKANLTVESILEHATTFRIVTTYPDESDPDRAILDQEVEAFRKLLRNLAAEINKDEDHRLRGKEFALRLVSKDGEVANEISLLDYLQADEREQPAKVRTFLHGHRVPFLERLWQ
jgi:DeoR/GlpR family transcriptional regulator of sugar metabolism